MSMRKYRRSMMKFFGTLQPKRKSGFGINRIKANGRDYEGMYDEANAANRRAGLTLRGHKPGDHDKNGKRVRNDA